MAPSKDNLRPPRLWTLELNGPRTGRVKQENNDTKTTPSCYCPSNPVSFLQRRLKVWKDVGVGGGQTHGAHWSISYTWIVLRFLPARTPLRWAGLSGAPCWSHGGAAAVLKQLFYDGRIGQCRHVAQVALVVGDLAQDAAHDLT